MIEDSYDDIEPAFEELAVAVESENPKREVLRERVIQRCLPLADHIARRYSGRGEAFDDLQQVARVGLIQAVDRFDISRGAPFLSFAVPTIMGEVRHHFRDHTWAVRVPRRTKEIQLHLAGTVETLAQRFGRMPRAREVADELEVDVLDVTRALIAANAYQSSPLDAMINDDGENMSPAASLGDTDPGYNLVEQQIAVRPHLIQLPRRERELLIMRFFESKTQKQIADHMGISQMHVSRILTKTLNHLREEVLQD
ncbi:MAG: polymerase sigma factor SigF [Nocardia sp.]|uniref:SigB/SigF/SigG family RNA polymerase sigma factor n=1 Tax=Nocardia sp. TaxID=1821 RepID=UPI0026052893|nr:SigB/SigF/SigG family RNA polymerase sigma factor [Nocardia sp.]MCU1648400.1 polymerase sigma factor SigF [Nocardia sp.]